MNGWRKLNLGDTLLAGDQRDCIAAAIGSAYSATGDAEMAAFVRHESGALHCDFVVYFTPAAASVGRRMGAQPCAAPATRELTLLAGSERAFELLSP
ncbi:hypothetical protein [Litorivivens sp.]|uniref:hypothetical protein n=1 Tax=Litorivivens sp. TaxID=2020868 RepID=UPI0035616F11